MSSDGDVISVKASEVEAKPTRWLWLRWLPLKMFSLLIGLPGLGKTTVVVEIAALKTRGKLAGDLLGKPADVLIASYEDAWSETLRPRLEAAGADLDRVHFLACRDRGRVLDLSHQLGAIERIARAREAKLLIIDPLVAGMPRDDVNSHRDQDVRSVLAPIATLAEQCGLTVLATGHFPKSAQRALLGMGGSVGFSAAARSILVFGLDPKDASGARGPARVLAHAKCNVGPLARSVKVAVGGALVFAGDVPIATSQAVIGEECDVSADDLVLADIGIGEAPTDHAVRFLRELLADGPYPAKDIPDLAADQGISWRTLERAKKLLGVKSKHEGKAWYWERPAVEEDAIDESDE